MKDKSKTKKQLINELVELRQRIAELEASETEQNRAQKATKLARNQRGQEWETIPND